jgi:hypothetical protein
VKNQTGFGVVGFLVLLPFLLSVVATIAAAALAFKADAHLKHECRVSVLNSQREAADQLKKLIRLNPRARQLRTQDKLARAAVKAAQATGTAPVIAAAEANLLRVRVLRTALAIQQKALLVRGKAVSYSAPLKARAAVMGGLAKEARTNRAMRPSTRTTSRSGRFNVKATPAGDLTPDYEPAASFAKDQIVDLDVTVDIASLLPEWLRALLPDHRLEISSHCQATVDKQENSWVETLNRVR